MGSGRGMELSLFFISGKRKSLRRKRGGLGEFEGLISDCGLEVAIG